jgi:hypothetical protein
MKRLYATLALLASFAVGNAQNIDVQAFAEIGNAADSVTGHKLCLGDNFSPRENAPGDSVFGFYGFQFNGPDPVFVGDRINYRTSFHNFLTQAECDAQVPPVLLSERYGWYSGRELVQTDIDNNGFAYSYDKVDSIGMLVDWAKYQQYGPDSIKVLGPPHETFQNGQAYGFFMRTWGIGPDANSIENTDPNMANNWAIVKIIWNDCTTSISDLIAKKEKVAITAYPNPASNEISVDYNFTKAENANIYIRDISGRTVTIKKLGHIGVGEHSFSVDISALTPGMYMLELSGGELSGVTKFNKQ